MKQLRYTGSGGLVLALVAGAWAVSTQFAGAQHKQIPRFVVEPGWQKPGPLNWLTNRLVTEEMGATCTDAKGHVVSLNRGNMLPIEKSLTLNAAPPVVEFDPSGNVVKAWGDRASCRKGYTGASSITENNSGLAALVTASFRSGLATAAGCSCRSGQGNMRRA